MGDRYEGLRSAMDARKKLMDQCPVNAGKWRSDKPCPECQSTTAGPCWLSISGDAIVVDAAKELLEAEAFQ